MQSASEQMRRVAQRLRGTFNIDAGLDEIIAQETAVTADGLAAAQAAVSDRVRELEAAWNELRQLLGTLSDYGAVVRFTPEGWPERSAQLDAAFAKDGIGGLADWVEDWCQAAAGLRIDALERLLAAPFPFPPEGQWLVEQLQTARYALAKGEWRLALPVLRAAAEGLRIGDREVPGPDVRASLLLLQARIGVLLGNDVSADLDKARSLGASVGDAAVVRAWAARRAGNQAEAAAYLADSRTSSSVPVIAEAVRQARESSADAALSTARSRVSALADVSDIISQLDRLVDSISPELWLAVAERAAADEDTKLAFVALDRAEDGAQGQFSFLALAKERRAELLARTDADSLTVAAERVRVGDCLWSADQLDSAEVQYRKAQQLNPDDVQTALSLASVRAAKWATPTSESAPLLADALTSLDAMLERGADESTAWALITSAALRMRLAMAGGRSSADHLWQSLLKHGRALAIFDRIPGYWTYLSDAFSNFGLYHAAVFAAVHAHTLEPKPDSLAELIRAHANAGDLTVARELLPEMPDRELAWVRAIDGFIEWRQGSRSEAIETLRSAVRDDPGLSWAQVMLICAYVLTGRIPLARREARQLRASIGDRRGPEAQSDLAFSVLLSGDLDEAERIGAELTEWESHAVPRGSGLRVTGMAKLLAGRPDGLQDLIQSTALVRRLPVLDDWKLIDLPVLRELADEQGVLLPNLAPVLDEVERRRVTLKRWADPLVELAEAPAGSANVATVDQARALLDVLLREADGQLAAARGAVESAPAVVSAVPEWSALADRVRRKYVNDCVARGELTEAAAAERERLVAGLRNGSAPGGSAGELPHIAQLLSEAGHQEEAQLVIGTAREHADPAPAELSRTEGDVLWRRGLRTEAAACWEAARAADGPRLQARLAMSVAGTDKPAATALLHDAISSSYAEVITDLRSLLHDPADISSVVAALAEAGSDDDAAPGVQLAMLVLRALPDTAKLPDQGITVLLPSSWFTGMQDPLKEHPLINQYIPEARLRLQGALPGVHVKSDDSLEPDGFRVLVLDLLCDQGKVPRNCDYAPEAAVPLLSVAARDRVTGDVDYGLVVLRQATEPSTGADTLLIVPPAQVVARHIEIAARTYKTALGQFMAG